MNITKIIGRQHYNGKYSFHAILEDGQEVVLRASATRRYVEALEFEAPVGPGKNDIARKFLYTSTPGKGKSPGGPPLRRHRIEYPA